MITYILIFIGLFAWALVWVSLMIFASSWLDDLLAKTGFLGQIVTTLCLVLGGPVIWILAYFLFRHKDPEDEA